VIAARSTGGEIVTYPIVETQQQEQVCRRVLVPADIDSRYSRNRGDRSHYWITCKQWAFWY